MSRILQTAPANYVLPVELEKAKRRLRVEHQHDDALITDLIQQAAGYVENIARMLLVSRTVTYSMDYWPSTGVIMLPDAPVLEITGITYTNVNNSPQQETVSAAVYSLDTGIRPNEVYLNYNQVWPSASQVRNGITVTYRAGLIDTDASPPDSRTNVPPTLEAAVLMVLDDFYRFGGAKETIQMYENPAVDALIHQNRCYKL